MNSSFSEQFDEDPDYLAALAAIELPGDSPSTSLGKRARDNIITGASGDTDNVYGASSFGGVSQFMQRKRAKLQIQNSDLATTTSLGKPQIFKGVQVYVRRLRKCPLQM